MRGSSELHEHPPTPPPKKHTASDTCKDFNHLPGLSQAKEATAKLQPKTNYRNNLFPTLQVPITKTLLSSNSSSHPGPLRAARLLPTPSKAGGPHHPSQGPSAAPSHSSQPPLNPFCICPLCWDCSQETGTGTLQPGPPESISPISL